MKRVLLKLMSIKCNDTEDVTGADEFYISGVVSDGETVCPVLTKPISINDGQRKFFGEGGKTIFDRTIPDDRILKVVLFAWDEDSQKDWSKYGEMVDKIGEIVSKGLLVLSNPYAASASAILPLAIDAVGSIMNADNDDRLGKLVADFPVWGIPSGCTSHTWPIHGGDNWFSNWNYVVSLELELQPS
jgi:hypothetical protein